MNFANPQAWHLLWLLPLIAGALHFFYVYRCKMTARFIQEPLLKDMAPGLSIMFYRLKAALIVAAFVLMVIALSRPQWGFTVHPIERHGLDIMVVIDVSKSMLTQDVQPSRLERTKLAIKDLVMKLNGSDHIGLIAFAGNAMVMCPLTYDYNGFLLSLDDLSTDTIPRGGTDISEAIDESIKAYQNLPGSDKAVVLVTDGEDQEGDAMSAARRAHEKGVKIFTVGVGTREGDLIQVTGADGQTGFLKDADGNVIKSHLNEGLLQQIAYVTGGAYIRSGGADFGLDYLYDRQLSKLKKHDAEAKMARLYDERFQWPLTIAFILLLIEALFSNRKNIFPSPPPNLPRRGGGIVGLVVFFIAFMPSLAFASVAGEVNKANDLYHQGKFDDSLNLYQEAMDKDAKSPVVKYDLGTALYKKGDYAKALGYLEQAAQDKNVKIKPSAEYNLGNVLYKSGIKQENTNVDAAIKSLQNAMGHYAKTLSYDPNDKDAIFNQEFVKKEIERLKQKKQQQQQQQNQQSQQNKQNQQQNKQNQQNQQNQQQNQQKNQQQNQQQQEQPEQQQNKQQEKQEQPSHAEDSNKSQQNQQSSSQPESPKQQKAKQDADQSQQDYDRRQADDLLENYKENEEPKKLLSYMPKKIDDRPVAKDW